MMTTLIVMAGLPGSGKSTVAEGLAARLGIGVLATDLAEAALRRAGCAAASTGLASYLVVESLTDAQLAAGRSVVVDAVNPIEPARAMWRTLAERRNARLAFLECVCQDETLHRARIEGRVRAISGLGEISWPHVQRRRASYHEWQDERLVLRSDLFGADALVEQALAYLSAFD